LAERHHPEADRTEHLAECGVHSLLNAVLLAQRPSHETAGRVSCPGNGDRSPFTWVTTLGAGQQATLPSRCSGVVLGAVVQG
jgi:hypothetical protein